MSEAKRPPARPGTQATAAPSRRRWRRRALRALALWLALTGVGGFLFGLWTLRYLPSVGADSLIYHLTLPAQWLRQGYLADVDLPFHDGIAQYSPMLSETLCWLLLRATGDDALAWLVQPAFVLATFWLYYRSARLLGTPAPTGLLLTGFLTFFPPFVTSAVIGNNDMLLTAGCAAMLYGLLGMRIRRGRPMVWAAGGLGLMLASKYIGVIYAAAAVPFLAPSVWGYVKRRSSRRRGLAIELAVSAAIILAGASFLIRNWALYGNPLYPAQVKLAGVTIFGGLYDTSVFARQGLTAQAVWRLLVEDTAQFGMTLPYSAILWLPVGLALVSWVLWRPDWRAPAVCVGYPAAALAAYFAFTPFWGEHRLLYPVYYTLWLAAAYAAGVPWLGRLGFSWHGHLAHASHGRPAHGVSFPGSWKPRQAVAWALLAGFAIYVYVFWLWDLVWLAAVAAAAGVVTLVWRGYLRERRGVRLAAVAAICLAGAGATGPLWYPAYRAGRLPERARVYDPPRRPGYKQEFRGPGGPAGAVWNLVEKLRRQDGPTTVAYTGTPIIFPLFSSALDNRVVYVPISPGDRPQATPLQAGVSIGLQLARQRRKTMDESYWLAGLRREEARLLLVADQSAYGGAAQELEVVKTHAGMFRLLMQSKDVYLFEILPPNQGRAEEPK